MGMKKSIKVRSCLKFIKKNLLVYKVKVVLLIPQTINLKNHPPIDLMMLVNKDQILSEQDFSNLGLWEEDEEYLTFSKPEFKTTESISN